MVLAHLFTKEESQIIWEMDQEYATFQAERTTHMKLPYIELDSCFIKKTTTTSIVYSEWHCGFLGSQREVFHVTYYPGLQVAVD